MATISKEEADGAVCAFFFFVIIVALWGFAFGPDGREIKNAAAGACIGIFIWLFLLIFGSP